MYCIYGIRLSDDDFNFMIDNDDFAILFLMNLGQRFRSGKYLSTLVGQILIR